MSPLTFHSLSGAGTGQPRATEQRAHWLPKEYWRLDHTGGVATNAACSTVTAWTRATGQDPRVTVPPPATTGHWSKQQRLT